MATTQGKTQVHGSEEVTETYIKHVGRFLIFKTEWWEKVSTEHIANDIFIETDRPIRDIYLNGNKLIPLIDKEI